LFKGRGEANVPGPYHGGVFSPKKGVLGWRKTTNADFGGGGSVRKLGNPISRGEGRRSVEKVKEATTPLLGDSIGGQFA